ncbi:MAG: sodium:proton antiporter, partial [Clostridiales bacterium]|nr:sodium:proton antiporter [Clostridiales bacterium]
TVFCNICPLSDDLMERADKWSSPVLCAFFVLSGAGLKLTVFTQPMLILVGVIYIVTRCFGKYFGAYLSAKSTGCSRSVTNYLGITLFPQEGVALGMCATAQALETDGPFIRNIILFGVLIYEITAPIMTREALKRSGDIREKTKEVLERRANKLAAAPVKPLIEMRKNRKR